jgi:hypothetical protein
MLNPETKSGKIAAINHSAVDQAKVFSGTVEYFIQGQGLVQVPESIFVEVGKWTEDRCEEKPEDFDCSYFAALLLGHIPEKAWTPHDKGRLGEGNRKLIIHHGLDDQGKPISLSLEQANIIKEQINYVLEQARIAKTIVV